MKLNAITAMQGCHMAITQWALVKCFPTHPTNMNFARWANNMIAASILMDRAVTLWAVFDAELFLGLGVEG